MRTDKDSTRSRTLVFGALVRSCRGGYSVARHKGIDTEKKYTVTAEHCLGASVAHTCTSGAYSDPTDDWEFEVQADDKHDALAQGRLAFEEFVFKYPRCECTRGANPGSHAWWTSILLRPKAEDK